MNIVFLGAPGSGKGTQASMLSTELAIPHISTGDLFRSEINNKTETGLKVKSYIDSGNLVPDSVVIDIIKLRISLDDCKQGFILDGFPRTIEQAEMLSEMMLDIKDKINLVVNFEIDQDILIKRISGRFSCNNCGEVYNKFYKNTKVEHVCDKCASRNFLFRSDDNEEVLKERLKIYNKSANNLVEFYKKNNLLISIDALESASLIFENLMKTISKNSKIN